MKTLTAIFSTVALLSCVLSSTNMRFSKEESEEWLKWRIVHGKPQQPKQRWRLDESAFETWRSKYQMVKQHNMLYTLGVSTYELELNQFAVVKESDFRAVMYDSFGGSVADESFSLYPSNEYNWAEIVENSPQEIDWRESGHVTRVKNQRFCAAGWAFAAAGAAEAYYFNKTKTLAAFSEQQLIDCVTPSNGCSGGSHARALTYLQQNRAYRNNYYRYKSSKGFCVKIPEAVLTESLVKHMRLFISRDEMVLQAAMALVGPVAVTFTVTEHFRFYKSGVYRDPFCTSHLTPKHSALIVGYGTDLTLGDYWIVKNSFGKTWGEDGYIRMARNSDNHCGIASFFSFPTENYLM